MISDQIFNLQFWYFFYPFGMRDVLCVCVCVCVCVRVCVREREREREREQVRIQDLDLVKGGPASEVESWRCSEAELHE